MSILYKDEIKKKYEKINEYLGLYDSVKDKPDKKLSDDFVLEVMNFTESLSDTDMIAFDYYGYNIDDFIDMYEDLSDDMERIVDKIESMYEIEE